MKISKYTGDIALLTTALIWGSGFIGVDFCLESGFPPSMINFLRFFIGAVAVLLVIKGGFDCLANEHFESIG